MTETVNFNGVRLDMPGRGGIYGSILETIGNTPLVRIPRISQEEGLKAELLLKLEFFNPLASVKDRIAIGMISAMEAAGRLKPGITLARVNIWQYRDRACLCGGGARLSVDFNHA